MDTNGSGPARVAIVGGGVAGLSAALSLSGAGARVTVYEAAPVVGGRFATLRHVEVPAGGATLRFPIEHGLHGFWRQYPNLKGVLRLLDAEAELRDAGRQALVLESRAGRHEHIEIGETVRKAPLPDLLAQSVLGLDPGFLRAAMADRPWLGLKVVADLLHPLSFDGRTDVSRYDDRTVQDYIGGWPSLYRRFFGALTRSAFLREPNEISLAAFLYGLTVHALNDKRDSAFDVLRRDPAEALYDPLRDRLVERGGRVSTRTPVRGLRLENGRATGVTLERRTAETDAVVLALDPASFRRLLAADDTLAQAIGPLHLPAATACVAVRLWFPDAPSVDRAESGVFGDGPADNYFWLHRLREDFAVWHTKTGGAVVECHLYGAHADAAESRSDDSVADEVACGLTERWPELVRPPVFRHVQRNRAHHPVFGPGDLSHAPGVPTRLSNVALAGDWIACHLPYLFMERACVTGLLAAESVARALGLPEARLIPPRTPEPPATSIALARKVLRPMVRRRAPADA